LIKEAIDVFKGPAPEQTKRLAEKLGFTNIPEAQQQMKNLFDLFIKSDATQVEINPFVETPEKQGTYYFHLIVFIYIF
jgi:succinyl-CoA synthetase beta subunit